MKSAPKLSAAVSGSKRPERLPRSVSRPAPRFAPSAPSSEDRLFAALSYAESLDSADYHREPLGPVVLLKF